MQFAWESIQRKGISGWQGLAVCTWCLSETYPIIFATGRAELMFHFRKHPLPLDPRPDVWHYPGPFHGGDDVHYLTAPGTASSAKLNLDRQLKAGDTSTMPHLTQKVKALLELWSSFWPSCFCIYIHKERQKHQTLFWTNNLCIWMICTPKAMKKNFEDNTRKALIGQNMQHNNFFSGVKHI